MEIIERVAREQYNYLKQIPYEVLKKRGQFFTSPQIAQFMASLVIPSSKRLRILDAGAGVGILTIALSEYIFSSKETTIHVVLYENDNQILEKLDSNLKLLSQKYSKQFTFEIRCEDFIISRPDKNKERYDIAVINPPYFKINAKTSPYSGITNDIFKGNPNIYASFMAVTENCLNE